MIMLRLTERAVEEIKRILEKYPDRDYGVRIFFASSSCSCHAGSYHITLVEEGKEGDELLEAEGVKIFLDPIAYEGLSDSIIDYQDGFIIMESETPDEDEPA